MTRHYKPRGLTAQTWEAVRPFVDRVLAEVRAAGIEPRGSTQVATIQFVAWAYAEGLDLTDALFAPELIAWFLGERDYSDATAATYRSHLARVATVMTPDVDAAERLGILPRHGRRPPAKPYEPHEVAALWAWASGHRTEHRRRNAKILVALGLGAGLTRADIGPLRVRDVDVNDVNGVALRVTGRSPRTVPVLATWEHVVVQAVRECADDSEYLFRPGCVERGGNLLNSIVRDGDSRAPMDTRRMRATWVVTHLRAGTPLKALLPAAAIRIDGLVRLLQFVPDIEPVVVQQLLRHKDSSL